MIAKAAVAPPSLITLVLTPADAFEILLACRLRQRIAGGENGAAKAIANAVEKVLESKKEGVVT